MERQYVIREIVGHKYYGNKIKYIVSWEGYDFSYDTEESPDTIRPIKHFRDYWDRVPYDLCFVHALYRNPNVTNSGAQQSYSLPLESRKKSISGDIGPEQMPTDSLMDASTRVINRLVTMEIMTEITTVTTTNATVMMNGPLTTVTTTITTNPNATTNGFQFENQQQRLNDNVQQQQQQNDNVPQTDAGANVMNGSEEANDNEDDGDSELDEVHKYLKQMDFNNMSYNAISKFNIPLQFLNVDKADWKNQPEVSPKLMQALSEARIPPCADELPTPSVFLIASVFGYFVKLFNKHKDTKSADYLMIFSFAVFGTTKDMKKRYSPALVVRRIVNLLNGDFTEVLERLENEWNRPGSGTDDDAQENMTENERPKRRVDERPSEVIAVEKAIKKGDLKTAMIKALREKMKYVSEESQEVLLAIQQKFPKAREGYIDKIEQLGTKEKLFSDLDVNNLARIILNINDLNKALDLKGFRTAAAPGVDGMHPAVFRALLQYDISLCESLLHTAQIVLDGEASGNSSILSMTRGFAFLNLETNKYRIGGIAPIFSRFIGRVILKGVNRVIGNPAVLDYSTTPYGPLRIINEVTNVLEQAEEEASEAMAILLDINNMFQDFSRAQLVNAMFDYQELRPLIPLAISVLYADNEIAFRFGSFANGSVHKIVCERGYTIGHSLAGFFAIIGLSISLMRGAMAYKAHTQEVNVTELDDLDIQDIRNSVLTYVDDIAMMCRDAEQASKAIRFVSSSLDVMGYTLAAQKSVIVLSNSNVDTGGIFLNSEPKIVSMDKNGSATRVLGVPVGNEGGIQDYLLKVAAKMFADFKAICGLFQNGLSVQHSLMLLTNYANSKLVYLMQGVRSHLMKDLLDTFHDGLLRSLRYILGMELTTIQKQQIFLKWSQGGFGFIHKGMHQVVVRLTALYKMGALDNEIEKNKEEMTELIRNYNLFVMSPSVIQDFDHLSKLGKAAMQSKKTLSSHLWSYVCERNKFDFYNKSEITEYDKIVLLSNSVPGVMQSVIVPSSKTAGLSKRDARVGIMFRFVGTNNFSGFITDQADSRDNNVFNEQAFECGKNKKDGSVCHADIDSNLVHLSLCSSLKYSRHNHLLLALRGVCNDVGLACGGKTEVSSEQDLKKEPPSHKYLDLMVRGISDQIRTVGIDVTIRSPFLAQYLNRGKDAIDIKTIFAPLKSAVSQKEKKYLTGCRENEIELNVFAVTQLGVMNDSAKNFLQKLANHASTPNIMTSAVTLFKKYRHTILSSLFAKIATDLRTSLDRFRVAYAQNL